MLLCLVFGHVSCEILIVVSSATTCTFIDDADETPWVFTLYDLWDLDESIRRGRLNGYKYMIGVSAIHSNATLTLPLFALHVH